MVKTKSKRFYLDSLFGQLHVRETRPNKEEFKPKRPVICFHQSPLSGTQYKVFQNELGRDRLVYCPDTPGFGGSDIPYDEVTISQYADSMLPLLEKLKEETTFDSFDVLGGHTGSVIALEIALNKPDLINKIILPSIAFFSEEERKEIKNKFVNVPAYFSDPKFVSRIYSDTVLNSTTPISEDRKLELFAERLRSGLTAWYAPNAVTSYNSLEALKKTTHKVLIILLEDMLLDNSLRASKFIENCVIKDLRHISHTNAWDVDHKEIIQEIKMFLE